MAKYIDADKLIEEIGIAKICEECQYVNGALCMWNVNGDFVGVCETIIDAPAADVVPVIRCRDCAHAEKRGDYYYCTTWETNIGADVFCCFAERREI